MAGHAGGPISLAHLGRFTVEGRCQAPGSASPDRQLERKREEKDSERNMDEVVTGNGM